MKILLYFLISTCSLLAAKKPNFIFILSDDIAQGDLGVYGQELIQTPRLDQIANEGTRYMQAYCGTSVCAPCRSSFFTGLHSGHCPVRGNYELAPEGQLPIPAETVTIGEVAKEAGYATATFGKWGMGFFDTPGSPHKQGIDRFFGYNCQRHAHSYFPTYLYDNDQAVRLPGNTGRGVGDTYAQELIQNETIKWVKENAENPFMLFYAITLPHGAHEIDDLGIYADKPWSLTQKSYAAQVTRIDSDIGELVDTLRGLGIDKDTLIVFTGDNGSSFNPTSEIGKLFKQDANGLRGYKRGMYEGALRQAAFAWWPGTVPTGRVDDSPWALWDLLPTFVEMSEVTPPEGYETDGHSLLSYLKGGEAPKRDYFYWELHTGSPIQAARWGDWKAVRNGIHKPIEIYDLLKDRGEKNNLAQDHPELVARAEEIFKESHRPDPNWPLEGHSAKHKAAAEAAWNTKRQRDQDGWVPPNARPLSPISASQKKWIKFYEKQKFVPAPDEMLINTSSEPDLTTGFTSLYNGRDLSGWSPIGGTSRFEAKGDTIVGTCVPGSPSTYLSTDRVDYTDFVFTTEVKWAVDSNTGVMFRAATKEDKKGKTVFGPQAEMESFGKKRFWSGGIYGQAAGGWLYPLWLDAHQEVRSAMKKDDWNRLTIQAKGPYIKTWLNGKPAAHWRTDEYQQGFFGLQIHAGKAGEVHFRNLKVKELK
ncbi:sulfatase-like hydrolase/transferase (plasmid) [Verrucomicrobiaceae bacterium 227]